MTTSTNTNPTPRGTTFGSGLGSMMEAVGPKLYQRSAKQWGMAAEILPIDRPMIVAQYFYPATSLTSLHATWARPFLLNSLDLTVSTGRCHVPLMETCRVPAMILAIPVEVEGRKPRASTSLIQDTEASDGVAATNNTTSTATGIGPLRLDQYRRRSGLDSQSRRAPK
jgi:hypothetical protein